MVELPPRARRIRRTINPPGCPSGTTSACAENTRGRKSVVHHVWNYLRVRGEYRRLVAESLAAAELPPRARRIPCGTPYDAYTVRTTSACAENTLLRWLIPYCVVELPPRARRIRRTSLLGVASVGTTSACAENTSTFLFFGHRRRNYLRVRGEYNAGRVARRRSMELPPRARRIRFACLCNGLICGTTSACAENTLTPSRAPLKKGNYLRVRGEYHQPYRQSFHAPELPPRARRIPPTSLPGPLNGGTTSACAENTSGK